MPLTALKVKNTGPGRHADAHGLYLVVQSSGSRSWLLRHQHNSMVTGRTVMRRLTERP